MPLDSQQVLPLVTIFYKSPRDGLTLRKTPLYKLFIKVESTHESTAVYVHEVIARSHTFREGPDIRNGDSGPDLTVTRSWKREGEHRNALLPVGCLSQERAS